MHGSYRTLISGQTQDGLVDLTGGVGYVLDVQKYSSNSDDLWNELKNCNRDDCLMGASIIDNSKSRESEYQGTGLLSGHAYGLVKCVEVNGTKLIQMRYEIKIKIRNPWGKGGEWKVRSRHLKIPRKLGMINQKNGKQFLQRIRRELVTKLEMMEHFLCPMKIFASIGLKFKVVASFIRVNT